MQTRPDELLSGCLEKKFNAGMSQELMFFLLAGLQNEPVGEASKKGVEISKVRVEENE